MQLETALHEICNGDTSFVRNALLATGSFIPSANMIFLLNDNRLASCICVVPQFNEAMKEEMQSAYESMAAMSREKLAETLDMTDAKLVGICMMTEAWEWHCDVDAFMEGIRGHDAPAMFDDAKDALEQMYEEDQSKLQGMLIERFYPMRHQLPFFARKEIAHASLTYRTDKKAGNIIGVVDVVRYDPDDDSSEVVSAEVREVKVEGTGHGRMIPMGDTLDAIDPELEVTFYGDNSR